MRCETIPIILAFHGWLALLAKGANGNEQVELLLNRRASVKDIIESLGVPHTEVGALLVDGKEIAFSHIPEQAGELIKILPHQPPVDLGRPSLLRPEPLVQLRFLADANVGKLAKKLRMSGFDTAYDPGWMDEELAERAERERRVLLSKDRGLLKRSKVRYGLLIREEAPIRQLGQVLHFFGLTGALRPYSRCIRCNGDLAAVEKNEVAHLLEPLTKKYYQIFQRCLNCQQIYWAGSHRQEMTTFLAELKHYQALPY